MLKSPALAAISSIRHGFFTREGGVSEGLYASLNCGPGSKDDPVHVAENRRRAAALLGGDESNLCTLYQVHGIVVRVVEKPFAGQRPEGDALVTKTPGLILGILTADCAPVLFADPQAGVIGAAHAGWRGAIKGVVQATLAAMEEFGASREHVIAAIGPCIAQESYEVDGEFRKHFLAQSPGNLAFFSPSERNGHFRFDLKAYLRQVLRNEGVEEAEALAQDTCADETRFFSYRRTTLRGKADYGRQLSAIMLS